MNLIIDIGNTCIKLVAFSDGEIIEEKRISHHDTEALETFIGAYPFDKGIMSSVVDLPDVMKVALSRINAQMMQLESGISRVPINIVYKSPNTLGADRLASAVGAVMETPNRNLLIIDIGTCITYDVVTANAEYIGGNISPGPKMRFKALHDYTSRLPLIGELGDCPEIGYDTETAMRSGVYTSIEFEVSGYIKKMAEKYDNLVVYITGGVHMQLMNNSCADIKEDRYLVPKGLNRILEYNFNK